MAGPQSALGGWHNGDDPRHAIESVCFSPTRKPKAQPGFPICRVVRITCLSSGALLNAAVGRFNGKGDFEQTLLRSIEPTLDKGDILLGDAFFPTLFHLASRQRRGIDILMEQLGARKPSSDFRKGIKLGQCDRLIALEKPKKKPYRMSKERYQEARGFIMVRKISFKHCLQVWPTRSRQVDTSNNAQLVFC